MSARVVRWARKQSAGGAARKLVLIALAQFADREGVARCGKAALAAVCEVEPEGLRRHLMALERAGLIERVPSFRPDGGQAENKFVLACPAPRPRKARASAGIEIGTGRVASENWGRA